MTEQASLDFPRILSTIASRPAAVVGAVIGNLIPVFGVLKLGWDPAQILILYWVENVILGVLTVPRIDAARRDKPGGKGLSALFVVHYGVFCAGHLVFALFLVDAFTGQHTGSPGGLDRAFGQPGFDWAVLGLFALNGVVQFWEWWVPELWRTADPRREMVKPYGRIVVLHLTLLLGAGLMAALHAPAATILLLCLLKAVLEIAGLGLKDMVFETPGVDPT